MYQDEQPQKIGQSLLLVCGAVLVGALTGLTGYAFLLSIKVGASLRMLVVERLSGLPPFVGFLILSCAISAAAALAALIVRRIAPTAGGSGVPYVEKILRGDERPRHTWVLPIKFIGGGIALSAGLLLGREGPMVQMGAVIGEKIGRLFSGFRDAWKPLMAAGAGAGLASAFNAPVGGMIFILEEVLRKVTPLSFVLTTTSISTAIFIQRGIFHVPQDYFVPALPATPASAIWLFVIFGMLVGVCGCFYNRLILRILTFAERMKSVPVVVRAALIGFAVGAVSWGLPDWMGGGDEVTQSILGGHWSLNLFLGVLALRFILGPLSYAAGTPGGLFAPIIAMGALFGALSGHFQHMMFPDMALSALAFTVVGMAAFFTATIRAPITGIVICLEMTGAYSLFFPMLAACLGAYLVPWLAGNVPIYDALAELPLRKEGDISLNSTR